MEINSSIPSITDYTYKVNYDIYIINYNILKIVSGMGSLHICILILIVILLVKRLNNIFFNTGIGALLFSFLKH